MPDIAIQEPCLMCLEQTPEPLQYTFACGCKAHIHKPCYEPWTQHSNRKCPICRKEAIEVASLDYGPEGRAVNLVRKKRWYALGTLASLAIVATVIIIIIFIL